jgi:amino acid adenylation domain-containing protein
MPGDRARSFAEVLLARAALAGDRCAFVFREDSGERAITYADLDRRARSVAAALAHAGAPGDRVLLMYPPGAEYVIGFFGCLYAGMIAVPVYPPTDARGVGRVLAVLLDSGAEIALLDHGTEQALQPLLAELAPLRTVRRIVADQLSADLAGDWQAVAVRPDTPAFLQYTSGSTGDPKGVVVGHDNLLHNSAVLKAALALGQDSVAVSWLPPYHDMGLIGGILQPIYVGFPAVLMSPMSFLRRPSRWLRAISEHRATVSVAPTFGYAECLRRVTDEELAEIDLSTWRGALVGAEPIRVRTLDAFADRFGSVGFRRSSFQPCYGLAEATLFVTGGEQGHGPVTKTVTRSSLDRGAVREDGTGAVATLVGCGHSRAADTVLVVDPQTRVTCADGTVGEVWVAGPTVAHGYWGSAEETGRIFRARLAGGDPRTFLCTGDLGFLDGRELYITGRAKEVLVLRGRNLYPHDLEAVAEAAHRMLLPNRAAAFHVDDGSAERAVLVHEVAADFAPGMAAEVAAAIRAAVVAEHGLYLDDVVLVRRGSLQRTSSGKTRRLGARKRYLKDRFEPLAVGPGAVAVAAVGAAAARPALDEVVARVLARPPSAIDRARPLVAQGLDSVRAVELRSALQDELGLEVSLPSLLDGASIAALDKLPTGDPPGMTAAEAGDRGAVVPASPGQARLWLLDRLGAGEALRLGVGLRLRGRVDLAALGSAFDEVIRRHEALRTTLDVDGDGAVWQTIRPPKPVAVPVIDLPGHAEPERHREIVACYWRELGERFDLRSSAPVRAVIARLADDDVALLVSAHHSAVDGWSMGVLWRELALLYQAFAAGRPSPLRQPVSQYRQVAMADAEGDGGLGFWRRELGGAPVLELPTDRPRSNRAATAGGCLPFELSADLVRRLRVLAEQENATLHMVLVAGLAAVLARRGGQRDVVLGSFVANRTRPGAERVVGFLTQVLPIRVRTADAGSFRELVARARASCLGALAHQDTPVERLLSLLGREGARSPSSAVRVALGLRPRVPGWTAGGVAAEPLEIPPRAAQFELSVELAETAEGGLSGMAVFAAELFDASTVRRLLDGVTELLDHAGKDPDRPLATLPVAAARERERIARFCAPRPAPAGPVSVVDLFESRVDRAGDAVAVVDQDRRLSYGELDRLANRLARHLLALGAGPGAPVGVCLPHAADTVVALLAILKAGAAYLPLDASYPAARLAFVVADARPAIVVSRTDVLAASADVDTALSLDGTHVLRLDADAGAIAELPGSRLATAVHPDSLAYVIYTSGSTGLPKGTANTHRGLGNQVSWRSANVPLEPGAGVLHRTPLGFDVSVSEILWSLVSGARLVVPPRDAYRDPGQWARLSLEQRISDSYFVPSVLRTFLAQLDGQRPLLTGVHSIGEELTPELVEATLRALPGVVIHNTYGPAEAAIEVTHERLDSTGAVRIPIGRPIAGVRIYLLDELGGPVPIGVPGELYISGVCLARGYLGRPGLTAERFVADPFHPGERMYRSGDLARWLPDGRLQFLGRVDHQVKIRGQRVEPGGVEAILATHPALAASVVVARDQPNGDRILVAYLVARATPPAAAELRALLHERLPEYMVPQAFVFLAGLPLNSSGKVDRGALPDPRAAPAVVPGSYRRPSTAAERMLADIWSAVLDVQRVGCDDAFRDLGGHSLMATQMVARIKASFGLELSVAELLDRHWTLAELAGELQRRQLAQADPDELRALLQRIEALPEREISAVPPLEKAADDRQ